MKSWCKTMPDGCLIEIIRIDRETYEIRRNGQTTDSRSAGSKPYVLLGMKVKGHTEILEATLPGNYPLTASECRSIDSVCT